METRLDVVDGEKRLPFKPIRKSHIRHCSYSHWHDLYV